MSVDKNFTYEGDFETVMSSLSEYLFSMNNAPLGCIQWTLQYENKWIWISPFSEQNYFNVKFSHKLSQENIASFVSLLKSSGFNEIC